MHHSVKRKFCNFQLIVEVEVLNSFVEHSFCMLNHEVVEVVVVVTDKLFY